MEKPPNFSDYKFNLTSSKLAELENAEKEILSLYELWESYLHFIKESNKQWRSDTEAKDSIKNLLNLENLWMNYRKKIYHLKNEEYEPISLIQYRMMIFIQKRQELREKKNSDTIVSNKFHKVNTLPKNKKKENKIKQKSLSTFIS